MKILLLLAFLATTVQAQVAVENEKVAVEMLEQSTSVLSNVGRAPSFIGEIEVVDGPRTADEKVASKSEELHEVSNQR